MKEENINSVKEKIGENLFKIRRNLNLTLTQASIIDRNKKKSVRLARAG